MRSKAIASSLLMIGLFVVPKPTFGQPSLDSNWSPWLGCWRLMQESVRDAGDGLAPPRLPDQDANDFRVCVVRNDSGPGVTMRTFADRRAVRSRSIVVDGGSHPVDETECRGTQVSQWSRDGHRLFTRTSLECKDQKKRTISGITLMTLTASGPAWVDVQAAHVNGDHVVTVRRYTPTADEREPGDARSEAAPRSTSPAQRAAAQAMTIDDVIEAGSKTTSQSLEAALVEASPRFDLNRRTLTRLDEAGVPDGVIDLMVGLSFPGRFRVERRRQFSPSTPTGSVGSAWDAGSWDAASGWYPYDPLWSADPYAFYYLSPFAFPYWWSGYAFDAWPANGGTLNGTERKDGGGRAVQGVGYTRVSSNREAAASGNGTGTTKSSDGTSSRQGYTQSETSSSGAGSGSGSSGSGSGAGAGSSGSGRTAQPR